MTLTSLITDARAELDNAEAFCREAGRPHDPIVMDRETAAFARLRALEDAEASDPERWGLVVEEPGTGSQCVPDFSKDASG